MRSFPFDSYIRPSEGGLSGVLSKVGLVAVGTLAVLAMCECSSAPGHPVVAILPSATQTCDASQTINYFAAVAHDTANAGVSWTLSGSGALQSATPASVVFAAPSTTTTATATITATSVTDTSQSVSASITIVPDPTITTTTLPAGAVNTAYSTTVAESGGIAPFTWSISSGTLPAGLTINPTTGTISGTPTAYGSFSFVVKVTDSAAPNLTSASTYTLVIAPPTLQVSTASLPGGDYGIAYSTLLTSTGGTPSYTWILTSGTLPTGLTLLPNGLLSGTPKAGGTFNLTVQVADSSTPQMKATKALTLTVGAQIVIAPATLNYGIVTKAYSATLTTTGGSGAITFALTSGSSLPPGLTLSSAGVISGTPTALGNTTFTVQATDSFTPAQTATQTYTLSIQTATVTIITTSLPNAPRGTNYSATLQASGGQTPYTWTIPSGTLPPGLTLSGATISGIPTTAGTYPFTVQATDSSTPVSTATQSLTIVVTNPAPLAITSTSPLPTGSVGTAYTDTFTATGGVDPLSWSKIAGTLPGGLTLSTAGVLSGTPTASGLYTFTVQVSDSENPVVSVTGQFTLVIYPAMPSGANDAEATGSYAFLFNAFRNGSTAGSVYGEAAIGQLTLDGHGNVTGVEDINTTGGLQSQVGVTGVYAVGSDNRGLLALNNGVQLSIYAISAGDVTGGVAAKLHFIEFDDNSSSTATLGTGTGIAKLQTSSAFAASTLKGSFVFGLQGETPCLTCATPDVPFGPVAQVGVFTGDGNGNLAGTEDAAAIGANYANLGLTGTYVTPSTTTGRGTLQLSAFGVSYPAPPTSFIYYVVSSSELLMMSSVSHATGSLVSGDAQLQQQTTYSTSSLSGNLVGYESSSNGGNGLTAYPSKSTATLYLLNIAGSGTGSVNEDTNIAGTFTSPAATNFTYTTAANGRSPLTIGSTAGPIVYLYGASTGMAIDTSTPALISFEPETIVASQPPLLSGTYAVSTQPATVPVTTNSGEATLTPSSGGVNSSYNGTLATTIDSSSPSGTLSTGTTASQLFLEASSGRTLVVTTNINAPTAIIYAISTTKAVEISTGAGNTPTVSVLEH